MLSASLLLAAIACASLGFFFTCCCSDCEWGSDNFDRADDTDINTGSSVGWTESSGTWAIVSNQLVCSSAGLAICDSAHPDGDITMSVSVDISHDTSGSTVDVIVGYAGSVYYYARVTFSSTTGTIQLRKYNSGIHSDISVTENYSSLLPSSTHTLTVCVTEGGAIHAEFPGTGVAVGTSAAQTITGTKACLSCSGSGNATFDNFALSKSYNSTGATDCPRCDSACFICEPGTATPYGIQAVVTGHATYNGTYLCDTFTAHSALDPTCKWTTSASGICSSVDSARVTASVNTGTGVEGWKFSLFNSGGSGGGATWNGTQAGITSGTDVWLHCAGTLPTATKLSFVAPCPDNAGSSVALTVLT